MRIAFGILTLLVLSAAVACQGDEEAASPDQRPSPDSPESAEANCREGESGGRTCDLGCEILPGIETLETPPSDIEVPFPCGDAPRELDFGGFTGRISQPPPLPDNLIAISNYLEFEFDEADPPAVAGFVLPLAEEVSDPSIIAFYTYDEGEWRRMAGVRVIRDGNAEGDFTSVPPNLVVLKTR